MKKCKDEEENCRRRTLRYVEDNFLMKTQQFFIAAVRSRMGL